MSAPTRPVLRYHGGKWRLAPWVISHFGPHRTYVEPYGGAASILLQKARSHAEVYNDLDDEVVNVFQVLRDPELATQLRELVALTPFARVEFDSAYEPSKDPIEQARRTIVKAFMGFGSAAIHDTIPRGMRTRAAQWRATTGFRNNSKRSGSTPATDWARYPTQIPLFVERLRGVVIENRDAIAVIEQHDGPQTLHYLDPPYLPSTRTGRRGGSWCHGYTHEMVEEDHRALAEVVHGLRGMVLISGYPSELYDQELFADWHRVRRENRVGGSVARTEVLWLNHKAATSLPQQSLFNRREA